MLIATQINVTPTDPNVYPKTCWTYVFIANILLCLRYIFFGIILVCYRKKICGSDLFGSLILKIYLIMKTLKSQVFSKIMKNNSILILSCENNLTFFLLPFNIDFDFLCQYFLHGSDLIENFFLRLKLPDVFINFYHTTLFERHIFFFSYFVKINR